MNIRSSQVLNASDSSDSAYPYSLEMNETLKPNAMFGLRALIADIKKFPSHAIFGTKYSVATDDDENMLIMGLANNNVSFLCTAYHPLLNQYLINITSVLNIRNKKINFYIFRDVTGVKLISELAFNTDFKEEVGIENREMKLKANFCYQPEDQGFKLTKIESTSAELLNCLILDAEINHLEAECKNSVNEENLILLARKYYELEKKYSYFFNQEKISKLHELNRTLDRNAVSLYAPINSSNSIANSENDLGIKSYCRMFMLLKSHAQLATSSDIKESIEAILKFVDAKANHGYSMNKLTVKMNDVHRFLLDPTNEECKQACLDDARQSMTLSGWKVYAGAMLCLVGAVLLTASLVLLGPISIPLLGGLVAGIGAQTAMGVGLTCGIVGGATIMVPGFTLFAKQKNTFSRNVKTIVKLKTEERQSLSH